MVASLAVNSTKYSVSVLRKDKEEIVHVDVNVNNSNLLLYWQTIWGWQRFYLNKDHGHDGNLQKSFVLIA